MAHLVTKKKAKITPKSLGLSRGYKVCKYCSHVTGPRSYICPSCKEPFVFKNDISDTVTVITNGISHKVKKVVDWTQLTAGEHIKVLQGSGPYHVRVDGERVYLGAKGIYRVFAVDFFNHGLHAYHVKNGGYEFIFMGKEQQSPYGCLVRSPHKIIRVKKRIRTDD